MVLFIVTHKVVHTLSLSMQSSGNKLHCSLLIPNKKFWVTMIIEKYKSVTIQMKVTEKYFPVVLFALLDKVVVTL